VLVFCQSLFSTSISKIICCALLTGLAASAAAHSYFFGVTELNLNNKSKHIEVIHQFTAHDIENTIAEQKQIHFSAAHPDYDEYIQNYIEENFVLAQGNSVVEMQWVGFEVKRGHLFAYQESVSQNFLANLVVKNTILVDTYAKQVNTVNYQYTGLTGIVQGSLTFHHSQKVAIIAASE